MEKLTIFSQSQSSGRLDMFRPLCPAAEIRATWCGSVSGAGYGMPTARGRVRRIGKWPCGQLPEMEETGDKIISKHTVSKLSKASRKQ